MNVLVDTSIWSLAFRRKPSALSKSEKVIVAELTELIDEGRAQFIGIIRQELLSGIKADQQYEKLKTKLRAFRDEHLVTEDFETAAKSSNECRSRGIGNSTVDMLICAVALRRSWGIFTTDPDFQNYQKALPINCHMPRT